jgi:hypothetical protein
MSSAILSNLGDSVNKVVKAALGYTRVFGWAVGPAHTAIADECTCGNPDCKSPGKHPLTPHGVTDATTDPAIITAWWHRYPWANVFIATGAESGFFVLDVDKDKGGEETLTGLEDEHGHLPETPQARTGGDGRHILLQHPGYHVPNRVGFLPGLDIRGDGGYIIASPSIHKSGRRYAWEIRPDEVQLAPSPPWLLDLVCGNSATKVTPPDEWRRLVSDGVDEGKRNASIARLAGLLLRHYIDSYVTLGLCLTWNAQRCRPPLDEDEVFQTVDSVARTELRRRQGVARRA